ncbi:MAG: hypothetical protein LBV00_01150 [Propionibacteriaceae bacterium]|jgi:uncharacterized membrane protein YesL|nr:hypothetical protein [Propionibacteriaceae bacterium]
MAASELSQGQEVGRSGFARVTAMIYWVMVLTFMFALTTAPGWVVSLFLAPDPSNLPWFVACLVPVGPALAALVFAWRRRDIEGPDLAPAVRFWRGYRLNLVDVLRWWAPYLAVLAVGGFVATNLHRLALPTGSVWFFIGLGAISALWAGHMIILTAAFSFRARDAARLGLYFFFHCFRATLLYLSLLIIVFACTYFVGMWLPVALSAILALFYVRAAGPMMTQVTAQFVAPDEVDDAPLVNDDEPGESEE